MPRPGLGAQQRTGSWAQNIFPSQHSGCSIKWKIPLETSGQRRRWEGRARRGRVGTPLPHWPRCSPTLQWALRAQSPDRVCGAQAGLEFPVASWLAWCLALGGPGYRVCQGVSACPRGRRGPAGAANAACVHPKCEPTSVCVCVHRGRSTHSAVHTGEAPPQICPRLETPLRASSSPDVRCHQCSTRGGAQKGKEGPTSR